MSISKLLMTTNKLAAAIAQTVLADKAPGVLDVLSIGFAALVAGSRAIPLGDNGTLLRDLAVRVGESNRMAR